MVSRAVVLTIVIASACANGQPVSEADPEGTRQSIMATSDSIIAAMVVGTSTADFRTPEWQGVNLNGTPMSSAGFEGDERTMQYDSIHVLDREVRV